MSTMVDLLQLIKGDIPDGRNHLQDSCGNLEKVASYCEGNYAQASEKRHALEETKNYTTQSLASVAYQINTLATNFLHLLDLQTNQLAEMESSINHLSQTVMIHKEKVARREIGVLTTNKSTTRPQGVKNGIIYPSQVERPIKYIRKPIDYNTLDEIGHGVKTQQNKPRSHSVSSNRNSPGQAPTTRPPTPPQQARISNYRQSSPYRSPAPPVSPPSVPSPYAPGHITQAQPNPYGSQQKSQYAAQGHYASQPQQKSQYATGQPQTAPASHYATQPQQPAPQQQPPSHYGTQQQAMQQQSHYSTQQALAAQAAVSHYATRQEIQQQQMTSQPQGHYGQHMPLQSQYSQGGAGHYGQAQQPARQSQPQGHYAHRQELQQAAERRASGYAAPGNMVAPPSPSPVPPTGKVQPIQQQPQTPPPPPPVAQPVPPSPPPPQIQHQSSVDSYEPPPPPPMSDAYDPRISSASPPLPPPPEQGDGNTFDFMPPPPGQDGQYAVDDISNLERRFQHSSRIQPEWVPEEYLEKVVAIYDYDKDKDDELSFTEGAVIYVVKKNDDGWYEGVMDGVAGLFPGNYVESLNEHGY